MNVASGETEIVGARDALCRARVNSAYSAGGATLRAAPGSRRQDDAVVDAQLMFFAERPIWVFLYGSSADMRKPFDGLYTLTFDAMMRDPL